MPESSHPTPKSFLDKPVFITDTQNAFFSACVLVIAVLLAQWHPFAGLLGYLAISMQSVTGINAKGPYRYRLFTSIKAVPIHICTVGLAIICRHSLFAAVPGVILLAFSFGLWRQYFPTNWPDINIPAGAIFFMAFSDTRVLEPLVTTAIGGTLAIVLQALLGIFIKATTKSIEPAPAFLGTLMPPAPPYRLSEELKQYCLLLGILMAIGVIIYRLSGYPFAYWLPYTAVIVLQISHTHTVRRIGERLAGTLVGCVVGSAILLLHWPILALIPILAVCIFMFLNFARQRYSVAVGFITVFVLLLVGYRSAHPLDITAQRLGSTLAGGALVFIGSFAFLRKKQL